MQKKKASSSSKVKVAIKNVLIVYKSRSEEAFSLGEKLCHWLTENKINTYVHEEQKPISCSKALTTRSLSKLDQVIVLGGDGTYLRAVTYLGERSIPVMGVNLGSLGFLTETRREDLFSTLPLLLSGKMDYQERSLLRVKLLQKNKVKESFLALNDVVIERGPYARLISLSLFSNESLINNMRADGLIISSPTGSTAYNLAAGGPIIHPDVASICITPICPHSLTTRPLVLPDHHQIRLKVQSQTQKACFMVDGHKQAILNPDDEIIIYKAKVKHCLVRPPMQTYFELLNSKLQFGQRL